MSRLSVSAERSSTLQSGDFTEAEYRRLIRLAGTHYRFESYETTTSDPHVIWRHDVDASPHRAARLAAIEAEEGARSVYCFLLHSPFYNLLEREVADRARAALDLGHGLGLHFDTSFYGGGPADDPPGRAGPTRGGIAGGALRRPVRSCRFTIPM